MMSSTISKRQQVWVCWQEPEIDRGKFSYIPISWIVKCITGDGLTPGSLVFCRWPRSEELFTAKVIHDPTPNDLSQVEIIDVPMFVEDQTDQQPGETGSGGGLRKSGHSKDGRQHASSLERNSGGSNSDDGNFVLGQLKRFFLTELAKHSGEMQANFDILGHRIGALEVNMKCVRERVERIENMLNTAANEFISADQRDNQSTNYSNISNETHVDSGSTVASGGGRRTKSDVSKRSVPSQQISMPVSNRMQMKSEDQQDNDDGQLSGGKATVIPRPVEQRVRKDRNPRPRAVVVTCPRNRNIVLLGGEERYRMQLPTYLDAIRHAKRPTATYMVTALLRRYLPPTSLSRLCVNERQLANTTGGQMIDMEVLEALKKQGRMQFPQTSIVDKELMLRIEDVTRDVRRKIKLKKAMASSTSKRSSGGAGSSLTPISMVAPQRSSMDSVFSSAGSKGRLRGGYANESLMTDDMLTDGDQDNFHENPEALPMFS